MSNPSSAIIDDDVSKPNSTSSTPKDEAAAPTSDASAASTPPPDGGLTAWLQVAAAWFLMFNILGVTNAYGQFQTIYETSLLSHQSPSNISWIGSVQIFLTYLTCMFSGPLWDFGHVYLTLIVGTFLTVFGMMMLSLCQEYWQIFLSQGIMVGIGFGFLMMAATATIPLWFTTKISFASGITATAASIGGIVYPIMLKELIPKIGFGWTVRTIAFVMLAMDLFCIALIRKRTRPRRGSRALLSIDDFKDVQFVIICVCFLLDFTGLYVFFYYIQLYAIEIAGTSSDLAFYLLPILNGVSLFGRVFPAIAAGYVGPMNTFLVFSILSGALSFCLIGIKNTAGVIVFSALYGFMTGPLVALLIPIMAEATLDKSRMGSRFGMGFVFLSVGVLIGEPIAGAILGEQRNWLGLVIWSGVLLISSSFAIAAARVLRTGFILKAVA